jgi:S1-C subfamily serine protease
VLLLAVIGAIVLVGGAWALSSSGGSSGAPQGPLPYLGMNLQNVPVNRVIVESVVPGSPADQAGIGPGDLLLSVNGQQVGSPADVDRILAGLHPGDSVTLQLQQGPVAITAQVQLADPPAGTP